MPRGDGPTDRSAVGGRPSLLPGGGLVLAVVAVLLFAAARQIDGRTREAPESTAAALPTLPSLPSRSLAPDVAGSGDSETVLDPLALHTLADPARLARDGSFTLQIAVACRKDTALRLLERAGSSADLYVLPAPSSGAECYRFCWGAFDARESAVGAALPSSLRGADLGKPTPRRVRDLTQ